MHSEMLISVVICAHNEDAWIAATLQSLSTQQRRPDEIIVVDNASTDNTAQIVQDFIQKQSDLPVRLVYEAQKGLHHAREAGWRAARGHIIAMTDADIRFPEDWLQIIEDQFRDEALDALTGIVRYEDAPRFINWVTWICDQLYQPEGIGKLITKTYVLNGGNSAYRREALEAVNGYINKPGDMLEDRYMSHCLHEAGFSIRFIRHLKVWHSFRRFARAGWRGYLNYIFFYDAKSIYADHLNEASL